MPDQPTIRLNKVLRELNISLDRAVEHLGQEGHEVEARPTTKISPEVYQRKPLLLVYHQIHLGHPKLYP